VPRRSWDLCVQSYAHEITHPDIALAKPMGKAQAAAAVSEQQRHEGIPTMNFPLMIALGLLFLAASFLVTHSTARTALVVLSCVAFLIAVILTFVGTVGVPGAV
jgi:hypothetical protein